MITKSILIIFTTLLLVSCYIHKDEDAIVYSQTFINKNEHVLKNIKQQLQVADSTNVLITLSTKPGSHLLYVSCESCLCKLPNYTRVQIANDLDNNNLSYVNFKKNEYTEYGFFHYRNYNYKDYYIRDYNNLNDTIKNPQLYIKQYYLSGNWILYSNERK